MANKIDKIQVGTVSYDINLPTSATPSITSLTVTGDLTVEGTSNLSVIRGNSNVLEITHSSIAMMGNSILMSGNSSISMEGEDLVHNSNRALFQTHSYTDIITTNSFGESRIFLSAPKTQAETGIMLNISTTGNLLVQQGDGYTVDSLISAERGLNINVKGYNGNEGDPQLRDQSWYTQSPVNITLEASNISLTGDVIASNLQTEGYIKTDKGYAGGKFNSPDAPKINIGYLLTQQTGPSSYSYNYINSCVLSFPSNGGDSTTSTYTFPNKVGTIALTSDIPSLYLHNITIYRASFCYLTFQFTNTTSSSYQSYSSLANALDNLGATYDNSVHCGVPCSGICRSSSVSVLSVPYAVHSNENKNGVVVCFGASINANTVSIAIPVLTTTISNTTSYQIVDLVKKLA